VTATIPDTQISLAELSRGFGFPWLIVIDNFLRDPDSLRRRALELDYSRPGAYPGMGSLEKIPLEGLTEMMSQLVREPLHTPWVTAEHAHQSCRLALASDAAPGRVHVDTSHWTGVLSLSKNEDATGGTEFFRHIPTGTEHLPLSPEELKALGYDSFAEFDADVLQKDALDPSKWEQLVSVPMRYNRLILLQPHYWHTAGPGFGDNVENGRLVYLMFFNRLPLQRPA
jgi:hypothetical protein